MTALTPCWCLACVMQHKFTPPTTTCAAESCGAPLCADHADDTQCARCDAPLCPECYAETGYPERVLCGTRCPETGPLCEPCERAEWRARVHLRWQEREEVEA